MNEFLFTIVFALLGVWVVIVIAVLMLAYVNYLAFLYAKLQPLNPITLPTLTDVPPQKEVL